MTLIAAAVIGSVLVALWPDKADRARWKYARARKAMEKASKGAQR